MKPKIWLVSLIVLLGACSQNSNSNDKEAQSVTKNEFREIDVDTEWDDNPFTWFKGQGLLLASGNREHNNAMTIGWGSLGNIWGKLAENSVTVYVSESRYTYRFMEEYDYFTVMAFKKSDAQILRYMGTHSGRDGDKAEELGLHTLYTEHGTPYYEEASLVLECKVVYRAPFTREGMSEELKEFYDNFNAGVHHLYIGNIVGAWVKD